MYPFVVDFARQSNKYITIRDQLAGVFLYFWGLVYVCVVRGGCICLCGERVVYVCVVREGGLCMFV